MTDPSSPALWSRTRARGPEFFTRALGQPPSVRGEPLLDVDGRTFRRWDPTRSKLGAALALGFDGPLPAEGEMWLYLGAAAGTTASHVADLVGPEGAVYAVEPSLRPFLRLLEVADRYPNLLPVLGDARTPEEYGGSVPIVDGLYADVSQPDQPEIVAANAAAFLRSGGRVLFVVKTASLGRGPGPLEAVRRTLGRLPEPFRTEAPRSLDPFHRRHYLVAARWRAPSEARVPAPRRKGPISRRSVRPGRRAR